MIWSIKTVGVYVADQQRAPEFYTTNAQPCLVLYPRDLMPTWEQLKPSVVFNCDDAQAACEVLAAKGVQITEQPKKQAWGPYAKFADPDGNEFLLVSP